MRRLRAQLAEYETREAVPALPVESLPEVVASNDAMYEGEVRLDIQVDGSLGLVVEFVNQLRNKPEVRIRRMETNRNDTVSLLLSLRQPVSLRLVLTEIAGVSQVQADSGGASAAMKLVLAAVEARAPVLSGNGPDI